VALTVKLATTSSAGPPKAEARDPVLSARGLRKTFGGKRGHHVSAVRSVDLDVHQGELVVLLGPSGCGKTTLLRMLAGLEQPDGGAIALGGRTVFDAGSGVFVGPEHRRVGMMFQSYALWPHMTVLKNAAYALESRRGPERVEKAAALTRAEEMLHRLGLEGLTARYPGELSGGQQQRVALARALLGDPAVVFFDEPLSNVDTKVRRRLRGLIRELKLEGLISGVYVTHDQEEAIELGDRVAVMQDGVIVQDEPPLDVYRHPRSMYVAEVIGEANAVPARLVAQRPGGFVAETPFGRFDCVVREQSARVGEVGILIVRPEEIRLCIPGGAASARRRHEATVRHVVPLGGIVELHVSAGEMELMLVTGGDERSWARGLAMHDQVNLEFPDDVLPWVPAEGAR
jgi:iron(III) transport system ATP-binding protein